MALIQAINSCSGFSKLDYAHTVVARVGEDATEIILFIGRITEPGESELSLTLEKAIFNTCKLAANYFCQS